MPDNSDTSDEGPNSTIQLATPLRNGLALKVTQGPGGDVSHEGDLHLSWDFARADEGSLVQEPLLAMADGTVEFVHESTPDGDDPAANVFPPDEGSGAPRDETLGPPGALGNVVTLRHEIDGTTFYSSYMHLAEQSVPFEVGETVEAGEMIGRVGLTGSRTGPHAHVTLGPTIGNYTHPNPKLDDFPAYQIAEGQPGTTLAEEIAFTDAPAGTPVEDVQGSFVSTTTYSDTSSDARPSDVEIERVSVASDPPYEHDTHGASVSDTALSEHGRNVAFYADAQFPEHGIHQHDVFVHNRETNTTERVLDSFNGLEPAGNSFGGLGFAANGRFLLFSSYASNIAANDTNGDNDLFVYDRQNNEVDPIALTDQSGKGRFADISETGRFVSFSSYSSKLIPADTNNAADVFVYDRLDDAVERISVATDGSEGNDGSFSGDISADGRFVAFLSGASNFFSGSNDSVTQVFVHDRQTDRTELVSIRDDGVPFNDSSGTPSISANGRYVAFSSLASNLAPGDSGTFDVFVHDRLNGTTESISFPEKDLDGERYHTFPEISGDGRYVVFTALPTAIAGNEEGDDGDVNHESAIVVYDRKSDAIKLVSTPYAEGELAVGDGSYGASISQDGEYIAFNSGNDKLVPEDTNDAIETFVVRNPFERDAGSVADQLDLAPTQATPSESDNAVSFTVRRDGDASDSIRTVYVSTTQTQGNANNGDYAGKLNQPLTFAAGEEEKTVSVGITDDNVSEPDETFGVIVQDDPNDPVGEALASASFTIEDDETESASDKAFPNTHFLEYFARVLAYDETNASLDNSQSPVAIDTSEWSVAEEFTAVGGLFRAVALERSGFHPVLVVRGTDSETVGNADWLSNASGLGVGGAEVADAWENTGLRQWLQANPNASLTGHSQGGAQAQDIAYRAAAVDVDLGQLVTFNAAGINEPEGTLDGSLAFEDITHFVSAGDVVSQAGEHFAPGTIKYYDLEHKGPAISLVNDAHSGHYAQTALYDKGEEKDVTDVENLRTPKQGVHPADTVGGPDYQDFVSPNFTHREIYEGVDDDYVKFTSEVVVLSSFSFDDFTNLDDFKAAVGSKLVGISPNEAYEALSDRAGSESAREDEVPTLIHAATLISNGMNALDSTGQAYVDLYERMKNTSTEVVDAAKDAGISGGRKITEFAGAYQQFFVDHGEKLQNAGADLFGARPEITRATAERVYSPGEPITAELGSHAGSTPAVVFDAGTETSTLSSASGSSIYILDDGPDTVNLTGGNNIVFGTPADIATTTINGFTETDELFVGDRQVTPEDLDPEKGSAILNINTDDAEGADIAFRLTGDFRLESFVVEPSETGTYIRYLGNAAPKAAPETALTDEGSAITIPVLDNDSEPDGDGLSIAGFDTTETQGTVARTEDGKVAYDPNGAFESLGEGETATDRFAYTVGDGNGGEATATVTVEIAGKADAEPSPWYRDGDDDGFGNPSAVREAVDQPTGYVANALDANDGDATINPDAPEINDGKDNDQDGETDEENRDPVLQSGSLGALAQDEAVAIDPASLLGDASDPDGDTLTVTGVANAIGGEARLNDDVLSFDPQDDFEGEAAFEYTASDGFGGTATSTVTVQVVAANDPPRITTPDTVAIAEGAGSELPSLAATDPNGDELTFAIDGDDADAFELNAASGALAFNAAPDFESPGDLDGDNRYELEVSVSDGGSAATKALTVAVADTNEAPRITSPATASYTAGTDGPAYTATAEDPEGAAIEFILSGPDSDQFQFAGDDGALEFIGAAPAAGSETVFDIALTASDGSQSTTEGVAITVGGGSAAPDSDGDGIADSRDNALNVANPDQRDTDGDGYGNFVDPDLDNDGLVGPQDMALFKTRFGTDDPDADLDGDGFVGPRDINILGEHFGGAPGPAVIDTMDTIA